MNLKITLSGQPGYLANLGLIWYCIHNGLMDPSLGWPVSLGVMAAVVGFYLLIRLGWCRRLRDPSMTVPQMEGLPMLPPVIKGEQWSALSTLIQKPPGKPAIAKASDERPAITPKLDGFIDLSTVEDDQET